MPLPIFWVVLLAFCPLLRVNGALRDGRIHGNAIPRPSIPVVTIENPDEPVLSRNGTVLPPYNTTYIFNQLMTTPIHPWERFNNVTGIRTNFMNLVSFSDSQSHTHNEYVPGGPIILMTREKPMQHVSDFSLLFYERNGLKTDPFAAYTGYLTNRTINGLITHKRMAQSSSWSTDFTASAIPIQTLQSKACACTRCSKLSMTSSILLRMSSYPCLTAGNLAQTRHPGFSRAGAIPVTNPALVLLHLLTDFAQVH